ncbi:Putative cytochrome P450 [Colletotrichum destructivum]|uniref:Cytochrome P450 n=1 Tax=Colletotrichum destructivum TaxID=34406 RepID=A0AAX4IN49_9PEZI|nr:Putative cytochrome P450 [Colletotrichum destructivum]
MLRLVSELNKCIVWGSWEKGCCLVTILPRIAKAVFLFAILFHSIYLRAQSLLQSFQRRASLTPTLSAYGRTTLTVTISTGNNSTSTVINTTTKTMHLITLHITFAAAAGCAIVLFFISLYKARLFFRRLLKDGAPMPPHHPILGHLGLMLSIMASLPRDVMPTVALADQVRRRYPHLDKAFYLDMWPFTGPMLMVISPDLMRQATQGEAPLPKVGFLKNYMKPISGGHDLVSMEGEEWKRWRDVFRPAFGRATELVPNIVENISVFRDQLVGRAKSQNGVFQLHHSSLMLAMDMSGKAIWDHNMDSQRGYNDMADAIVSQLRWLLVDGFMPFASLNFIRPMVHKYNSFRMERYIAGVQQRHKASKSDSTCVISRAVAKVRDGPVDKKESEDPYCKLGGEKHFNRVIKSQMRFLLLAGYDTTGSTITYVLHILSQHPEILAKVREEHNEVLGTDISRAAQQLKENPHLVNRVPYTTAVLKETLRMYPPTSTLRNGKPGFYLNGHDSSGSTTKFPTEGCMIFGNHHGLHHNPRYWKDPERFIPERFLVSSDDLSGLHPLPDAWRPFEKGPRACMGSELAMVEIKAVIMLVAREFDFTPAYQEWDSIQHKSAKGETKIGLGVLLPGGAPKLVSGDRVYQTTGGGGSHPADGYPCRVRFARGV